MSSGALLFLLGLAWHFGWLQALRLGHLPGDLVIQKQHVRIYIPITTSLLISALLSFVLWLLRR